MEQRSSTPGRGDPDYLAKHDLPRIFKELSDVLNEHQPPEPIEAMIKSLTSLLEERSRGESVGDYGIVFRNVLSRQTVDEAFGGFTWDATTELVQPNILNDEVLAQGMDNEGPSEASREMAAMAVSGGACTYPQSFQTGRRFSISAEPYTPSEDRQFHRVVVAKSEDVKERIRGAVKNNLLFRNLDSEQLSEVIDAMFEKKVAPGSVIIREGDEGDYFYVIERGRFEVIKGFHSGSAAEDMMGANNKDSIHELPADKQYTHGIANQGLGTRDDGDNSGAGETGEACVGKVIVTLSEGETFGELALMYGSPRTATVKACDTEGDYLLWAVDRTTFRCIVIDLSFRKRKLYESFLRSVPLLHTLFDQEIFRICDALNPVNFGPGSLIVRQGDVGHDFFVIEEGSADVYVSEVIQNDFEGSSLSVGSSDGEKKDLSLEDLMSSGVKVASISRGDYFGELALIRDAPRAASVISTSEVRCLCLSKADFIRLLGPLMPILQRNQEHYRRYEEYLVC